MARNSMLAIETSEAQITTATITVKALQVGKKQMTQSLVRQLPEHQLIDHDKVDLIGIPWGWVNYYAPEMSPGRQFICQIGSKLFRCPFKLVNGEQLCYAVYKNEFGANRFLKSRYENMCKIARVGIVIRLLRGEWMNGQWGLEWPGLDTSPFDNLNVSYTGARDDRDTMNGMIDAIINPPKKLEGFSKENQEPIYAIMQDVVNKCRSGIEKYIIDRGFHPSQDDSSILERIQSESNAAKDYCRRWNLLMGRLVAVEQLFIAC